MVLHHFPDVSSNVLQPDLQPTLYMTTCITNERPLLVPIIRCATQVRALERCRHTAVVMVVPVARRQHHRVLTPPAEVGPPQRGLWALLLPSTSAAVTRNKRLEQLGL